jgi:FSR family fosmidomycin resistance protein-like MFS transporter
MGQSYLKNNIGVASGITLGSAIGMGGAAVPITGLIADHYGLENAMLFLLVLPIIAFFLAQTLPSPEGLEIPTK